MKEFKVAVEIAESDKEYDFECYENDVPIEMGEHFLFYFAGIWDIGTCMSETEKVEINPNDKKPDPAKIDLVAGFWTACYKIKTTNFDLTTLS